MEAADNHNIQFWMETGETAYKAGRTTDAINAFNRVLSLDRDNLKAQSYLEMIYDVLNFYDKDQLNP